MKAALLPLAALTTTISAAPAFAASSCPPGVYVVLDNEGGTMMKPLKSQLTAHRKMSNVLGYVLSGGMMSFKVKSVIPGPTAAIRTASRRPTFYLCFQAASAATNADGEMAYVGTGDGADSPMEYRLVRFDVNGQQREIPVNAVNVFGPKTGAVVRAQVPFRTDQPKPGIWRLVPQADLPPGEYGFMQAATGLLAVGKPRGEANAERIYDFAVTG